MLDLSLDLFLHLHQNGTDFQVPQLPEKGFVSRG